MRFGSISSMYARRLLSNIPTIVPSNKLTTQVVMRDTSQSKIPSPVISMLKSLSKKKKKKMCYNCADAECMLNDIRDLRFFVNLSCFV